MSEGIAGTITLYDSKGNPVTVSLRDGKYTLTANEPRAEQLLEEILERLDRQIALLMEIVG